jgi:hypothetical protein
MAQTIKELKEQSASFKTEINEIYQEINDEVGSSAIGGTSESKTAEFRLWEYVWSCMSWIQQQLWDAFKLDLQAIAEAAPTCNAAWWNTEVRKYQHGDELLFNATTAKYYYAEPDEDLQIIKRVAVVDQSGYGVIKVAKETAGSPVALSEYELTSFQAFVARIQPFGSNISIISQDADLLNLPITIHYDAIVPLATVTANVEAAVAAYLSGIVFDGRFYTIRLVDAIQAVTGVVDVIPGVFEGKQDGGVYGVIDRSYNPVSGYMDIDPDFLLADTITYESI